MAKVFTNKKGFKVIKLSIDEARSLSWGVPEGMICMHCNEIIDGDLYFPLVLNDVFCKKCYEEWENEAEYFPEDSEYEIDSLEYYSKLLNIQ
jgi:hypothetical protein